MTFPTLRIMKVMTVPAGVCRADGSQDRGQQTPGMSHRCDLDALTWGVRAADRRPERDDVEAWVAGGDEAAFEAGVDDLQRRLAGELPAVHGSSQRQQR